MEVWEGVGPILRRYK